MSKLASIACSVRAKAAVAAGRTARGLSRLLGKGQGGMVGGKVALKVDPSILKELAAGRQIVLVTGTNGKSTTTRLIAQALGTLGNVAANLGGDNMTTGIVTALMQKPNARYAVLEVDEMHLPSITRETSPKAIVLLNLSRDQLDRVGEIGAVEACIREAVESSGRALIVANCDDPLISSAAWDAPNVQWVAAGTSWYADSTSFPRTGTLVTRDGSSWSVDGSDEFVRPAPDWHIESTAPTGLFTINGPNDVRIDVDLQLPGRANRGNAAQAAATASSFGVRAADISRSFAQVEGVAGRYQTYDVNGRLAKLLLAKNPAGWQEALTMVPSDSEQIVIAVNGQVPDGEDLSWLWDVDFSYLRGVGPGGGTPKLVVASGERAADLAVCLEYAGIDCITVPGYLEAIRRCESGPVQVLANYTAFRDMKKDIERL